MTTRDAPSVIPVDNTRALRLMCDREAVCLQVIAKARSTLGQINADLTIRIRTLEVRLLESLKKANKNEVSAIEMVLGNAKAHLTAAQNLQSVLECRPAKEFADEFIELMGDCKEDVLSFPGLIELAKAERPPPPDSSHIMSAPPITSPSVSRVRCMYSDPKCPFHLFMGFETGGVSMWTLQTIPPQEVAFFDVGVYPIIVIRVVYIGERGLLLTGGKDKTIRVWDIERKECVDVFTGHDGRVRALCPVGATTLYSASFDRRIICWDLVCSRQLKVVYTAESPIHCMVIVPNVSGKTYAVTGHRNGVVCARAVNTSTHTVDPRYPPVEFNCHSRAVLSLCAFGDFVFSGGEDNLVVQVDTRGLRKVKEFRKHVDSVVGIAVVPPDILVTASQRPHAKAGHRLAGRASLRISRLQVLWEFLWFKQLRLRQ